MLADSSGRSRNRSSDRSSNGTLHTHLLTPFSTTSASVPTSPGAQITPPDANINAMIAEEEDPAPKAAPGWQRWLVVVAISLGAGVQYTMRVNLSVALTRMPQQFGWGDGWDGPLLSAFFCGYLFGQIPASALAQRAGAKAVLVCHGMHLHLHLHQHLHLHLHLHCTCTAPARGPAHRAQAVAVVLTSVLNACIPLAAASPAVVFALRAASGLTQAATFPTCYQLFSVWACPSENARVIAVLHLWLA